MNMIVVTRKIFLAKMAMIMVHSYHVSGIFLAVWLNVTGELMLSLPRFSDSLINYPSFQVAIKECS